ncbi:hypothetical protein ACU5AX_08415 [Sphingomonas sp. XXL09]|uniref:hypothetical protein n=1 Tax=Sphingomonas sp. XXL09 TaxID=3457787 RepID=UPI00406BD227
MSRSDRTEAVVADMDRIFGPLVERRTTAAAARPAVVAGRQRRRSRWWMLGAPALVLVAGTALGLTAIREGWQPPVAATRSATPDAYRVRAPAMASRPSGAPAMVEPDSVAAAPAPDARNADVDAPAAVARDADSPPSDAPAMRPPTRTIIPATRSAAVRGPAIQRRRDGGVTAPDCPPGSLENRCIYQDVLAAHNRLYRAFERAKADGVSNRDLTAVTRRWRDARDRAEDDPDGAIRRYNQLADQLDDLRQDARP